MIFIKFKKDVFEAIMWEFLLNHLKYQKSSQFSVEYCPDSKGLFISKNESCLDNQSREGFRIGLSTIRFLIEIIRGNFVKGKNGYLLENVLEEKK